MGRPYSQDLRDRVLSAVDGGMLPSETAELVEVNVSYVYKLLIRRRTTEITTALPWAAGPRPKLEEYDKRCAAMSPNSLTQRLRRSEPGCSPSMA